MVSREDLAARGLSVQPNLELNRWDHAARVAHGFCESEGFQTGRFSGDFVEHQYLIFCLSGVEIHNPTRREINGSGWPIGTALYEESYATGQRAAFGYCEDNGFGTGFLTGFYGGEGPRFGVVCIPSEFVLRSAVIDSTLSAAGWTVRMEDMNRLHWAQIHRAMLAYCAKELGYLGTWTGHRGWETQDIDTTCLVTD